VEKITVNLGPQSYEIMIGSNLLDQLGSFCRQAGLSGRCAIVTNPTVAALYLERVAGSLKVAGFNPLVIELPDGEQYKTIDTVGTIYDQLIEGGLDRRCFIVALGGGVVGDMAGFAAATYLRGIPFVQVPTTLLAQVDSSVGGKTGVDHRLGKNLIGAFYQPTVVVADVDTLSTLPVREYRAGLAEVVKYGMVLDAGLFELLEREKEAVIRGDKGVLARIVARCCRIKADVVEKDERESGLRAVLNYGHTLGHAFETLSGYSQLLHGEAISIGMVLAAGISKAEGLCSSADEERLIDMLIGFGLPVTAPDRFSLEELASALSKDKKSRAGSLNYICNNGIGGYAMREFTPDQLAGTCKVGR
jgi:3-dehydroquinate synthase